MIFLAMILLGCLLGFAGAGGAGLTITLLSVGFGVPIHTALGVALAAMSFTMLSGAVSHFREGDVLLRLGLTTGGAGMLGAFAGARVSDALPGDILSKMTAALMLASSVLLYFILFRKDIDKAGNPEEKRKELQDDYRGKFANPYRAAELGYVDEVIDPAVTRLRLIRSFEMLANKRQSNPPKKHSNLPL